MTTGKLFISYHKGHRSKAAAILLGAATLTFDQKLRSRYEEASNRALADDWRSVGNDLRKSMRRLSKEYEAA